MSKVTSAVLLLFLLLSPHVTFAKNASSVSDSATIKLQVVVTEAMIPQKCTFGFESDSIRLSHANTNDCSFDSSELRQEALQLTTHKLTQHNRSAFVMVTVTAP